MSDPKQGIPDFVYAESRERAQELLDQSYLLKFKALTLSEWERAEAAEAELVVTRARIATLEAALKKVADAYTAWTEDHNDGEFAYWKSDDLMMACVAARSLVAGVDHAGTGEA